MSASWKVTLPCTRAEADAIQADEGEFIDAVLMTSEADASRPDEWRLDAYFETQPSEQEVAALRSLVPSAAGAQPLVERLQEEDWVTLSQQGLEPIRAGRFFVHTPRHRSEVPEGAVALEIDAGRAFGTGHHETTTGCLIALDRMSQAGDSFGNLLDLGTGTGLLAFAALRLWPEAKAAASDIDPVSIDVTEENAGINAIPLGSGAGEVELAVAPGLDHPRLKARAPYDLIIANILAGPLIELAPSIATALAEGGSLMLAGLLETQAEQVEAAYVARGLKPHLRVSRGDWPTLVMRKAYT
jgi:ribosomal protein L11 methyltransferase